MTDHTDIVKRLMRRTFRPTRDMVQAFEEQGNLTNGDARLHQEAAAEITRLRAEAEALRKDAERYRWLNDRYLGADFDYGGSDEVNGICVLIIKTDESIKVWGSLDLTVDAALDATKGTT